jgi:hypothetical protein
MEHPVGGLLDPALAMELGAAGRAERAGLLDAHTSVLGVEVVSGSITSEAGTVFPSNVGAASGG